MSKERSKPRKHNKSSLTHANIMKRLARIKEKNEEIIKDIEKRSSEKLETNA